MRGASAVVGVVVVCVTIGCTLPSTFRAVRQELANLPIEAPPASTTRLPRYKGVIHVHTHLSHDSRGDDDEILRAAKAAGLDFLMLTDHNDPAIFERGLAGEHDGVLIVRGAEMRCDDQYVLGLGLTGYIDAAGMSCTDVARAVSAQGGVPIGAHPKRFTRWDDSALAGVEVWDLYDEATSDKWRYLGLALDVLVWYRTYPDQILARIIRRPDRALAAYDAQTATRRLTAVATPDAHQNIRVLGRQLDPYPLALRLVPVYLLATERTPEALLDALRRGRAYFAFELFKPAEGFVLRAVDAHGAVWHLGDAAPFSHGLAIEVSAPHRGLITILHNGRVLARAEAARLSAPAPGPGAYRAEVALAVRGRWRPWIFSNPVYVR